MKLKKFLALLLALLLAFSLVACGDVDEDEDDDDDEKSSVSDTERDEDKDDEDEDKEDEDDKDNAKITDEGTEIFAKKGITVTYEGYEEDSIFGTELIFKVANGTEDTVHATADYCAVNGFMVMGLGYSEVEGGATEEMTLTLSNTDLQLYEIKTVKTVAFFLEIIDEDYNSVAKSDLIELTLSEKKVSAKDFSEDAQLLLDKKDIKIYAVPEINMGGSLGPEAYLYVENNSDEFVYVTDADGVKVNGKETTSFFISDIFPGAKVLVDITIYEEDLEENGISEIESLETNVQIIDSNTYNNICETGNITIEY